jgi:hypothetical protein
MDFETIVDGRQPRKGIRVSEKFMSQVFFEFWDGGDLGLGDIL